MENKLHELGKMTREDATHTINEQTRTKGTIELIGPRSTAEKSHGRADNETQVTD